MPTSIALLLTRTLFGALQHRGSRRKPGPTRQALLRLTGGFRLSPGRALSSPLIQAGQLVAVLRVVPALEVRPALLGEGGARFEEIGLGAVLMQRGGELLLLR